MKFTFEVFVTISSASWIAASVPSMSYQDPINLQYVKPSTGANPCNPPYWYPKSMPGYCYKSKEVKPPPLLPPAPPFPPMPMPMPYPVPSVPAYPPMMYSAVQQYAPPPPPLMLPLTGQMPFGMPSPSFGMPLPSFGMPSPSFGMPSPSFGMPLPSFGMPSPSFGMPPAQPYYPPAMPPQQQAGLVPGLPGLVSRDGGINILPFSDAYSDMLEKHKQKMIRKRLQKVLDEYDDYPYKKQKYRKY